MADPSEPHDAGGGADESAANYQGRDNDLQSDRSGRISRWPVWVLSIAIVVVAVFMLSPRVGSGPSSLRSQCKNNLKQIALALHDYHEAFGYFPPAYIADENGKAIHSWRVLILPFFDQKPLYDEYHFDEPWDGPNNRKLHGRRVAEFKCPASDAEQKSAETNYLAVVGSATAWNEDHSKTLKDFTDGPEKTILVVEVVNSGVHWMEPRDLHVLQMNPAVNPKAGQGISSPHKTGGANVLFADGRVVFLMTDTPVETIKALLTLQGGEDTRLDGN
jgi:prepilin-type processing-associated H-X9-DG protein